MLDQRAVARGTGRRHPGQIHPRLQGIGDEVQHLGGGEVAPTVAPEQHEAAQRLLPRGIEPFEREFLIEEGLTVGELQRRRPQILQPGDRFFDLAIDLERRHAVGMLDHQAAPALAQHQPDDALEGRELEQAGAERQADRAFAHAHADETHVANDIAGKIDVGTGHAQAVPEGGRAVQPDFAGLVDQQIHLFHPAHRPPQHCRSAVSGFEQAAKHMSGIRLDKVLTLATLPAFNITFTELARH